MRHIKSFNSFKGEESSSTIVDDDYLLFENSREGLHLTVKDLSCLDECDNYNYDVVKIIKFANLNKIIDSYNDFNFIYHSSKEQKIKQIDDIVKQLKEVNEKISEVVKYKLIEGDDNIYDEQKKFCENLIRIKYYLFIKNTTKLKGLEELVEEL